MRKSLNENKVPKGNRKGYKMVGESKDMKTSKLDKIITETIHKVLNENVSDSFYNEEDVDGNVGEPGMIKAYDIGYNNSVENFQFDAKDNRMPFKKYLKYWWDEINADWIPFQWIVPGKGYGHEGDIILRYGNVVFRDIYGQLMVDEYPPREM